MFIKIESLSKNEQDYFGKFGDRLRRVSCHNRPAWNFLRFSCFWYLYHLTIKLANYSIMHRLDFGSKTKTNQYNNKKGLRGQSIYIYQSKRYVEND